MKINILTLIISIIATSTCIAQKNTLLESYYSPVSRMTYSVGDTLNIGSPNPNVWSKKTIIYSNIFKYQKDRDSYSTINVDLSNTMGVIENIYSIKEHPNKGFANSIVLEVKVENIENLFITIDKAIKAKEIVIYPNTINISDYIPFDKQNATILVVKEQKLNKEQAMLSYIEKINSEKFNEWKRNEFLYEKEKATYLRQTDSIFKTVNPNDTMILVLPVSLGDYDFENNTFPITRSIQSFGKSVNFAFSNEYLVFSNFNDFSSVNTPKDKAEVFANINEKTYKGIRSAFVILKVTVDNISISEKTGGMNVGSGSSHKIEYTLSIIELHCVDNSELYYNYIGN